MKILQIQVKIDFPRTGDLNVGKNALKKEFQAGRL